MKNKKPLPARAGHDEILEAAGPRKPLRKPPRETITPLLLQPNLRRTSLLNLLGRPNPRINRQDLRRKRALHIGRVVFAGMFPRNFAHSLMNFGAQNWAGYNYLYLAPAGFLLGCFPADFFKISVGSIEKVLSS